MKSISNDTRAFPGLENFCHIIHINLVCNTRNIASSVGGKNDLFVALWPTIVK